jgi:hypothetical protein
MYKIGIIDAAQERYLARSVKPTAKAGTRVEFSVCHLWRFITIL